MSQTISLLLGDSFERISELEPGSVIAVVTDPPYGISFMNRKWDKPTLAPTPEEALDEEDESPAPSKTELHAFGEWARGWLQLCYEKLPPGGAIKVFGATRTYHRMAAAMEKVGFIGLHLEAWVQGQGFPKSLDISKAIDKTLGKSDERPVIGTSRGVSVKDNQGFGGIARGGVGIVQKPADIPVTGTATLEAQKWQGWGTALKPSWEPFIVGWKP